MFLSVQSSEKDAATSAAAPSSLGAFFLLFHVFVLGAGRRSLLFRVESAPGAAEKPAGFCPKFADVRACVCVFCARVFVFVCERETERERERE